MIELHDQAVSSPSNKIAFITLETKPGIPTSLDAFLFRNRR